MYHTAATLHTLETWRIIVSTPQKGDNKDNNNNNNNNNNIG